MSKDDNGFKNHNNFSLIQEWLNAHMQYIESLEYLKAGDFVKSPEKIIEKQIRYSLSNNLALQEYLKKSWSIMTKLLTKFPDPTSNLPAQNFSSFLPDDLLGRISNSIFTPTYMGLNPFELAKSFAGDLTTDLASKGPKANESLSSKTRRKKKNSRI